MRVSILVFIAAIGCGKKVAPEPYAGPLTVDLVMSSKDVVNVFDAWDDGFAKLQAKLGRPTKIDGKKHFWAALKGDDCAYTSIEKTDGTPHGKDGYIVGAIQSPGTFGKHDAIMNRAECLEILGKGVAPENPNTAGPPAMPLATPISRFRRDAVAGRSKWDGQRVRITGILNQAGDAAYVYDDTDPNKVTVRCGLEKPDAATGDMGKIVTLEGTVKLEHMVSGEGEPSLQVSLEHCAFIAPGPGPIEKLIEAAQLAHLKQKWGDAISALTAALGGPQLAEDRGGKPVQVWTAIDGDGCAELVVVRDKKADVVESISTPARLDAKSDPKALAACTKDAYGRR